MTSYLELFAKALDIANSGKRVERSRYELEKTQEPVADHGRREMDSTSEEPSSPKETKETEPKEGLDTKQALKKANELLWGDKYILSCTCGSWGHLCEEVEHYCPTKCLRIVSVDRYREIKAMQKG
jgi:hypothetical protein